MSANPFIDEFDEIAHAAFLDAGLADIADYSTPAGVADGTRRVYVDTDSQLVGDQGQFLGARTLVGVVLGDGAVARGGKLAIAGRTYKLQDIAVGVDGDDGSLQWWVVT